MMNDGPSRTRGLFPACAVVFTLAGCAMAPSDESAVSTVGDPDVVTGLSAVYRDHDAPFAAMVHGRDGARRMMIPGLFSQTPPAEDLLKHQALEERRIAAACSLPDAEPASSAASTMPETAGGAAQGYVQKEFEKYAVAYTVQTQYPFYRSAERNASGFAPELAARCFRIVRYDARNNEIRLDAIVQLRLDSFTVNASSYRDAVQIRPLRVYFKKGSYEENRFGDKVSLSASIAVDAVWFEQNRGNSGTVLNYVFLPAQTFEASETGDHFRYYGWDKDAGDFSSDWSQIARLPLPPFSAGLAPADSAGAAKAPDSSRRAPPVTFRVAAAEAGPVPASLKLVGNIVSPTADLAGLIANTVKRALGIPAGL
jgi:hypothetical protein